MLATAESVNAVSLAGIAERVGMHKSALLRYFETREEIFLRLAETEWREWADALVAVLAGASDGEPEWIAWTLGRSFSDRPLFCQLLLQAPLTLERNVSIDVVRTFKRAVTSAVDDVADALHRALPALERAACFELLVMTATVAAGMWQAANPPPVVAALYAEAKLADGTDCADPGLPELPDLVVRFVHVYLTGLRQEPRPAD